MFDLALSHDQRHRTALLAAVLGITVLLGGCSGGTPAAAPEPQDQQPTGAVESEHADPAAQGDSDTADPGQDEGITLDTEGVETACDAVFLFTMGQTALILGPSTGGAALTQADVDEVFGVLDPHVPAFSDDLGAAYSTYQSAATEAIGQDASSVIDIFAREDVVEAEHTMRRGLGAECADW